MKTPFDEEACDRLAHPAAHIEEPAAFREIVREAFHPGSLEKIAGALMVPCRGILLIKAGNAFVRVHRSRVAGTGLDRTRCPPMHDFAAQRRKMVDRQIVARGIGAARLLAAMRKVPREAFVPEHLREFAYDDRPLPIEADQTISQPYIAALMIEAGEIGADDRVLEIGAGSGYAAGLLGEIAAEVFAVERHKELAELAAERMRRLGYRNVKIRHGDGSLGWPDKAPFDAILVAASGARVPKALLRQLASGGRLVMPIGEPQAVQNLVKVTRKGEEGFQQEDLGAVRFVPLIGQQGWPEEEPSCLPSGLSRADP